MKHSIIALLVFAAACSKKPEPPAEAPKPQAEAPAPTITGSPEKYVSDLQKDVRKAEAVKDVANQATEKKLSELEQTGE